MRRIAIAVFGATLAHLAPASAADAVRCDGVFGREATHAQLVQHFGAANVEFKEILGPEGVTEQATVLFPRTAPRYLEVIWRDAEARARPAEIRIWQKSAWAAPGGIKLGDTIATIEKRNGQKLQLSRLDWQYAPVLKDWRKGTLGRLPGGCTLTVHLGLPKNARSIDENPTEAQIRASRPFAQQISVAYPE